MSVNMMAASLRCSGALLTAQRSKRRACGTSPKKLSGFINWLFPYAEIPNKSKDWVNKERRSLVRRRFEIGGLEAAAPWRGNLKIWQVRPRQMNRNRNRARNARLRHSATARRARIDANFSFWLV